MAKLNHPPAFLFYPDDFSSDGKVEAMTTEQVGAYILLLCKSWREDPPGSIPDNDCVLARWARLTPDRWMECRTGVLAAFTLGADSRWHQKRQRREYEKLKAIRKEKSKAAQHSWNQRRASTCITDPQHHQSIPSPSSIPITSSTKNKGSPPDEQFDSFWEVYPKRVAKFAARKAWLKIPGVDSHYLEILESIGRYKLSGLWDEPRFIPNAATFLNGKRWEDSVPERKVSNGTAGRAAQKTERGANAIAASRGLSRAVDFDPARALPGRSE